jgi:uncharacterized protein
VDTSRRQLLDEAMVIEVDGETHLRGSRCRDCATTTFPRSPGCPRCGSGAMTDEPLPRRGTLWTFTTQGYPPKPPYRGPADPEAFEPFALGYVDLGDVIVESRLTETDPTRLAVGMELELTLVPLVTGDDGVTPMTYSHRPVP